MNREHAGPRLTTRIDPDTSTIVGKQAGGDSWESAIKEVL